MTVGYDVVPCVGFFCWNANDIAYIIIYGLCNDAMNSSHYIQSINTMISMQWIWKYEWNNAVLIINHISSSGPLRKLAPASLASWILWRILCRFPSKSRAHWFNVQTATVTLRPMVLKHNHCKTRKENNLFKCLILQCKRTFCSNWSITN